MKVHFLPLCLCLIFSGARVFAQLSKEEEKEWKKRAKEMSKSPEDLKKMSDERAEAKAAVNKLTAENNELKTTSADKDSRIAELESLIAKMRVEAATARAELERLRLQTGGGMPNIPITQAPPSKSSPAKTQPAVAAFDYGSGVIFKVQVGAFKNKDLSKYFNNNPNFGGEAGREPGDPQRINIGIFRNYWEADLFKKYMREMGVKDAWIVPYKDGKRVEIKDVLDAIVTEPTQ
jgi:hypothetical protein